MKRHPIARFHRLIRPRDRRKYGTGRFGLLPGRGKVSRVLMPLVVLLLMACLAKAAVPEQPKVHRFKNLPKLLHSSGQRGKFTALTEFDDRYEESIHTASIDYLKAHPDLVERIRKDLGSDKVSWQLEGVSHRLIYAPEANEEVGGLFADYCIEAIADMMRLTGLANPYSSISTRMDMEPGDPGAAGIRAIIVRDLAREYVANYRFSGGSAKRIQIGLSGRIEINEVGSYSSYLQYLPETDDWSFTHAHRTLWKIDSANPYTVLMTPLEETLHIVLREHTEKAILAMIRADDAPYPHARVQDLVEEWLAVEEAVVGALVYTVVPEVVLKRIPDLPQEWIEADLSTKDGFEKYRHLRRAIEVVRQQGLRESIEMYSRDPKRFRELLALHS